MPQTPPPLKFSGTTNYLRVSRSPTPPTPHFAKSPVDLTRIPLTPISLDMQYFIYASLLSTGMFRFSYTPHHNQHIFVGADVSYYPACAAIICQPHHARGVDLGLWGVDLAPQGPRSTHRGPNVLIRTYRRPQK